MAQTPIQFQPPPPQPLRPEQIADRLSKSTVLLEGKFVVKGILFDDTIEWLGSGVIVQKRDNVYTILSNAHVVGTGAIVDSKLFIDPVLKSYELVAVLPDGKQAKPVRIRVNRFLKDFALITIPESAGSYTVLTMSTIKPTQGQRVFAMGHPLRLPNTFTTGVISSLRIDHTILGEPYRLIQTDAAINHGNSGGPLVNEFADLIGINTFVYGREENAQGLNFAISTTEVLDSIQSGEMVDFPLEPGRIGPFAKNLYRGASGR